MLLLLRVCPCAKKVGTILAGHLAQIPCAFHCQEGGTIQSIFYVHHSAHSGYHHFIQRGLVSCFVVIHGHASWFRCLRVKHRAACEATLAGKPGITDGDCTALCCLLGVVILHVGDWGSLQDPLGPSCIHLEASDGHRKRKGEKANINSCLKMFEGFWLLRGFSGELFGPMEPSRGGLRASWSIFGAILRHPRPS